jgi:thiol-disulfide isomerase/thioredoxin
MNPSRLVLSLLLLLAAPLHAAEPVAKPEFPALAVDTLDGGRFDLAQERGRWVVVNYWATWCAPCIKEIPDLSAFDAAREDVRVIGLAFEEIERADLDAFLRKHPASYPIAVVDVYDPPKDFDVPRGLPTTYLVDPQGRLAQRFIGPVTSIQLAQAITDAGAAK